MTASHALSQLRYAPVVSISLDERYITIIVEGKQVFFLIF